MHRRNFLCLAITLGLPLLSQQSGFAQNSVKLTPQQTGPKTQENANSKPPVDSAASSREQKLAEYLSGAIFSGPSRVVMPKRLCQGKESRVRRL